VRLIHSTGEIAFPSNARHSLPFTPLANTQLHLVHPLGFRIDDKILKRAGLDCWPWLESLFLKHSDNTIKPELHHLSTIAARMGEKIKEGGFYLFNF